ncbi:MAG: hypothetical protein AB8G95_16925 [Anaerolineae bacterium]
MFGSATLEVILGMIFVFLLLSVICSTINEWIASSFNLRAKTMQSGIRRLLEDPEGQYLAKQFYDHPLIKGLSRDNQKVLPSYIPAETFTMVLMDLLAPQEFGNPKPLREVYVDIQARLEKMALDESAFGRAIMLLMDETGLSQDQLQELRDGWSQVHDLKGKLKDLQEGPVGEINIPQVQGLMDTITRSEAKLLLAEKVADQAILNARQKVGEHFDNAMDRVSGWYKRQSAVSIFGIALVVSVFLNVDSISLASSLANNPTLRNAVVAAADNGVDDLTDTVNAVTSDSSGPQDLVDELNQLGLPIGWNEQTTPKNVTELINKLLGWIVTTVAVSMGAPFWFDILSKVSSVRIAGKKPDRMAEASAMQVVVPVALPQPQLNLTKE